MSSDTTRSHRTQRLWNYVYVYIVLSTCITLLRESVHMFSWLVSTPQSVPIFCTLCQPVPTVSTSNKMYRFAVSFKILTKQLQVGL